MRTDGPRFRLFCREFIRHTKGRWFNQPLILSEPQQAFWDEALVVDEAGRRIYTEIVRGLPKKNGKSTEVSAFGLYMTALDGEEGAEVYAAAASKEQARVIFGQGRDFIDINPALADLFVPRRNYIESPRNRGLFRVLSSDAFKQHGINPSCNLIDELWAHESPDMYVALTSATGAREQPLTVTITTAPLSEDPDDVLGAIYKSAMEDPRLERPDPYLAILRDRENGFLFWWHGAPEGSDPNDPEVWRRSNPAPWITAEYLRRERNKRGMRLSDFVRFHLNMVPEADEESLLPAGLWADLEGEFTLDPELPVAVAVYLAQTYDIAAIAVAQRQALAEPKDGVTQRTVLEVTFTTNPYPEGDPGRGMWQIDTAALREDLRALYEKYPKAATYKPDQKGVPAAGPAFLYPSWLKESAQMLAVEGLNMLEFPSWDKFMVPATNTFVALARDALLVHGSDAMLAEHVGNAVALRRDRGWRISARKKSPHRLVEGATAAVMAVHQAQVEPPKPSRPGRAAGF
jgi:phage terminase large subunit-like protein